MCVVQSVQEQQLSLNTHFHTFIFYADVANGLSASEQILLHKLKKDTKDQSNQISKLTDLLAVAVRENVALPHCTQWEYVKVWHLAYITGVFSFIVLNF
jgi:hypothetical protein